MKTPYTHIADLAKEGQPPEKGILSRTLFNDDSLKAVMFRLRPRGGAFRTHRLNARHPALPPGRGETDVGRRYR
jgi:hypothetical protein